MARNVSTIRQVIVVPLDNPMTPGKLAAQVAHAAVGAAWASKTSLLDQWRETGVTKIVLQIPTTAALLDLHQRALDAGYACCLIRDEGRTEVAPNSVTALAIGPSPTVNSLTGHLALYKA